MTSYGPSSANGYDENSYDLNQSGMNIVNSRAAEGLALIVEILKYKLITPLFLPEEPAVSFLDGSSVQHLLVHVIYYMSVE